MPPTHPPPTPPVLSSPWHARTPHLAPDRRALSSCHATYSQARARTRTRHPPPQYSRTRRRPTPLLLRRRSAIEEARLLVADFARRDSSTSRLLGAEPATEANRTGSGRLLGSLRPAGAADRFVMEPPALLPPIGSPAHASLIRERTEGGLDIVMGGGAEAAAPGGRFAMQPPALAPPGGVSDTGRIQPPPRVAAPKGNRKMPVRTRVGIDEPDGSRGGPSLTRVGDGVVAPVHDAPQTVRPQASAVNEPLPPSVDAVTGKATVRTSLTIAAKAERARKGSCFEVGSRLSVVASCQ